MTTLAVQFLEYPHPVAAPEKVRERLRMTFDTVPVSMLLLGWNLPSGLEEVVAKECTAHRVLLYRWHPLLASDSGFSLPVDLLTRNLAGQPVPGFRNLPEFTFLCPNRSAVQEWLAERIDVVIERGIYSGLFLDRVRFPSPADDPEMDLACFCEDCRRMAADAGLDLEAVRRYLSPFPARGLDAGRFIRVLFESTEQEINPLVEFLDFRIQSINRTVRFASRQTRAAGMQVGLDCFSPALTRMVGQDLHDLNEYCDWIKIMTYPRVHGPAGLPFEIHALVDWLVKRGMEEHEALTLVSGAGRLPHLPSLTGLQNIGYDSEVLSIEIDRARASGVKTLLAGLALVEVQDVHRCTDDQIRSDLQACGKADGLVLSWDLWHIPHPRIDLLGKIHANPG